MDPGPEDFTSGRAQGRPGRIRLASGRKAVSETVNNNSFGIPLANGRETDREPCREFRSIREYLTLLMILPIGVAQARVTVAVPTPSLTHLFHGADLSVVDNVFSSSF